MSDINGNGYGSSHDWERLWSNTTNSRQKKATHYKCRKCGATFSHFYDIEPNIFKAMELAGVSKDCKKEAKWER